VTESREGKTTAQHSGSGLAGARRVFKHFSGFDFFLFSSVILSLPPAGNASR